MPPMPQLHLTARIPGRKALGGMSQLEWSTRYSMYHPPSSRRPVGPSIHPLPDRANILKAQQPPPRQSSHSHPLYPRRWLSSSSQSAPLSSPNPFTYNITASYSGKRSRFKPELHHFSFAPTTASQRSRASKPLPRSIPDRSHIQSGQDACFVTTIGTTTSVAFGVADGVGGWQDQGIDSAAFAHGICMYMEEAARRHAETTPLNPRTLLKRGYDRVCHDEDIIGGGSTACVAVGDSTGILRVANLGDSGFMQLRAKAVHYFSDPQTHAFNTPYQLSRIPPKILAQVEEFGGAVPFSDMPSDASVTEHEVRHGDVLVFATDGVWDNLCSQDMLELVCERMEDAGVWVDRKDGPVISEYLAQLTRQEDQGDERYRNLQTLLATDIVQVAKEHGMNGRRDGPFAKAVQKAYPMEPYHGGKPDDICVVVAIVVQENGDDARKHGGSKL